jgi:hypothetical protein
MSDLEEKPVEPSSAPDPGVEGRRRAAAVLEVLGGAKSPAEAADALGITLATYYVLEGRALEGLIASCEPRARGGAAAPGKTLQSLRRENDRLRQDLTRTQALARAVQRAEGMPADGNDEEKIPIRRSRRRPRARALRAARILEISAAPPPPPISPSVEPPP